MDRDLYRAATLGNVELLRNVAARNGGLLLSEAPQQQTALHIAARLGHAEFVEEVLQVYKITVLLTKLNSNNDTPLHLAARNGKDKVVEILINCDGDSSSGDLERGDARLVRMINKQGNTALHETLLQGHDQVAIKLLNIDRTLSTFSNTEGEFPLHLAAKAALPSVVQEILTGLASEEEKREMVIKQNNTGRTALHYAARINNDEIVGMLLQCHLSVAYITDNNGYSPLHIAAASRSKKAFSELLEHCPDALEQHDLMGRNALHIFAYKNKRVIEGKEELLQSVINEPDRDGNTLLHLAAMIPSPRRIKSMLLKYKGLDLNAKNNVGLTFLDIIQSHSKSYPHQVKEHMKFLQKRKAVNGELWKMPEVPSVLPSLPPRDAEPRKERSNTFALAIALMVTVSFGAIFTMPGGYSNDGTPALAERPAFKAFLLFNAISLCCSVAAGVCLLRDTEMRAVGRDWHVDLWSLELSGLAFTGMMLSFVTAVYVMVAPKFMWLFSLICVFCFIPFALDLFFVFCVLTGNNPHVLSGIIISKLVRRIKEP